MREGDSKKVTALLDRIAEVCPIPAAAQRVVMLTSDVNCDIRKVAEALAADPALAAETMRIANSAVFRRTRAVETLGHAVLTLGLAQIHQMASAMALMAAFRTEHELSLEFHHAGVLAGSLAGLCAGAVGGVDHGAAFLAGLLGEVGAMACVAIDGERFSRIFAEAAGNWPRRGELERQRYDLTSWQIGGRLLARNQLPESICRAVGSHYDDEDAATHGMLTRTTILGRVLAPAILALPADQPLGVLGPQLLETATRCGLAALGEERLVQLADQALARAEATFGPD